MTIYCARAIGTALAQNESLSLVTGGFYGVGETVGLFAYCENGCFLLKVAAFIKQGEVSLLRGRG